MSDSKTLVDRLRAAFCAFDLPFPVTAANIAGAAKVAEITFKAKRGPKKVRMLQSERIAALEARVAQLEALVVTGNA